MDLHRYLQLVRDPCIVHLLSLTTVAFMLTR